MKRVMSTGDIANVVGLDGVDKGEKDESTSTLGQNRRKRACRKPVAATASRSQSKKAVTGMINSSSPCSQAPQAFQVTQFTQSNNNTSPGTVMPDLQQLHTIVQDLQAVVQAQQDTIQQLSCQLQLVLSFLTNFSGQQPTTQAQPAAGIDHSHTNQTANSPGVTDSTDSTNIILSQQPTTERQPTVGYADAVRIPANLRATQNNFRDAIATAVYIDKKKSEDRANTFIVTGISESENHNNSESVYELCASEFDIELDIVTCRRLGRDTQPGRSRPLLVVCRSVNEVRDVLASAKLLRQSTDPVVRKSVYINPNLTKAEATAAYEIRCQRRQATQRRAAQQGRSRDENTQSRPSTSSTGRRLNVNANEWMPSSQPQQQQLGQQQQQRQQRSSSAGHSRH